MEQQERLNWLETRRSGIGGSDAAKVMGLSPYGGPLDVYLKKINPVEDTTPSEAAYFGTELEEFVAREFTRRSGVEVKPLKETIFSEKEPFMLANVDRVVIGENKGLECKTASAYKADEWEGDNVPDSYYVQTQHYCEVMGWEGCYIACLVGGQRFVWKYIPRNDEFITRMIADEGDFWNNHVVPRIPPSRSVYDSVYLPQTGDSLIAADDDDLINAERLFRVRQMIKELEEEKELRENALKSRIGENAGIAGVATFKANKPRSVTDWESVARELGASDGLIAAHTTEKPGPRVFRFSFKGA